MAMNFHEYFEGWISEQNQHLQDLISASRNNRDINHADSDRLLSALVQRVLRHYEQYYRAKSIFTTSGSVLRMLTPSWRSLLENGFLWIGGWRPTMAFHLLYSKFGLQLQSGLSDLIHGRSTGDLADLSHDQLHRVDELQRRTIIEERETTEKMARVQETVADGKMVELSQEATEGGDNDTDMVVRVAVALTDKEDELEEMIHKADDLRLRTLKGVINILTPMQSVHFLIAAAELHLRVHEWGKKKDEDLRPPPPPLN